MPPPGRRSWGRARVARLLTPHDGPLAADPIELAIRVLLLAAIELPVEACRELARRLTEYVVVHSAGRGAGDATPSTGDQKALRALREVADMLGHAPSTTEYMDEYRRRRTTGENPIPTASAIIKRFGSWASALAEAGIIAADVGEIHRLRVVRKKRVGRYPDDRLLECLRACAAEIGFAPTVVAYSVWREVRLGGGSGRRAPGSDIPHFRTIADRFGGWGNALEAAGLDPSAAGRSEAIGFSRV